MIDQGVARIGARVFSLRGPLLGIFAIVSVFLAWHATGLKVDAGFEKLLPLSHPYMQTFVEYREEFGGANRLLVAVRARKGDIFTPEVVKAIQEVTDEVFFLPGVNRSTVQSIVTPNVRFVEIVEGGFAGGNVMPADFAPTPDGLVNLRENVLKAGIVGRLVSNDFTTAMVSAQLVENDPRTGERLDYLDVASRLEEKIRTPHVDDIVDIHVIGFVKTIGDIASGAAGVVVFFGISFVITAILVWLFTRSLPLTALPLLCSVVAVIWDLGLLAFFGFGLDPMSILVPFLVFAIGISHGAQMVNGVRAAIFDGLSPIDGARRAFERLLVPGAIALFSDTIGFLTILLIDIRIIQELALTAAMGVMVVLFTNLLLLPLLLSYVRLDIENYRADLTRRAANQERLWEWMGGVTRPPVAATILALSLVLLGAGWWESRGLAIGDLHAGVPELRPESRYNRDTAVITDKFSIGVDIMTVIAVAGADACIDHASMTSIDRFQWAIANVEGVQSTLSLPQIAKVVNAGWNEGNLAWRVLSRNAQVLSQSVSPVETSTGLLNRDCSVMPVMVFTEDHKAETIDRVVAAVEGWSRDHPEDPVRFRLATGNVGVMAATNQVISAAQFGMLLWVYLAIVVLCLLTFRSVRATVCIVAPLGLVSVLCYALMSLLEIGLKVSTLPVAALGVGIGVDYGIYIFSRMEKALEEGANLRDAYVATLAVTGNAVLLTGFTLAIGVSTWVLSELQFQADMGLLLAFMFLANMLAALLLLPAMAVFVLGDKPITAR